MMDVKVASQNCFELYVIRIIHFSSHKHKSFIRKIVLREILSKASKEIELNDPGFKANTT